MEDFITPPNPPSPLFYPSHHKKLWSAICFKIMTRYTCGFFARILAVIPATRCTWVFCHVYLRSFLLCGVFIPKCMTIFLFTRIYMRPKKARRYALQTSKIWFLFISLTVVVVVGSPTTDLLESADCLLRDCVRYFTDADRNNDRFS